MLAIAAADIITIRQHNSVAGIAFIFADAAVCYISMPLPLLLDFRRRCRHFIAPSPLMPLRRR